MHLEQETRMPQAVAAVQLPHPLPTGGGASASGHAKGWRFKLCTLRAYWQSNFLIHTQCCIGFQLYPLEFRMYFDLL